MPFYARSIVRKSYQELVYLSTTDAMFLLNCQNVMARKSKNQAQHLHGLVDVDR
ncbi:hypothetical protein [Chamaesiphon minutus]|uniref:Uncharacterized protein n=1 Tax=Chamaesiphon minutus (strain ATCC 27169 / PCC 6605) TaxID=1173020 RepID=K9UAX3_CHAP6|nr:hypothetical protein [Chamaesiphon minutus]AFY91586.1 hypothetical protein Cha6605_0286 [Chamaesiphon minutus PCC 6605]